MVDLVPALYKHLNIDLVNTYGVEEPVNVDLSLRCIFRYISFILIFFAKRFKILLKLKIYERSLGCKRITFA